MTGLRYVGPPEVLERVRGEAEGTLIESLGDLVTWLDATPDPDGGWRTYVVDLAGRLLVAPRRSEHVACAGTRNVLAAGEIRFDKPGRVQEVTNQSTGYCPPEDCWLAVATALDRAKIPRPSAFTFVAKFRLCPACGERNLVKEDWFVCTFCDADLPEKWNFDPWHAVPETKS